MKRSLLLTPIVLACFAIAADSVQASAPYAHTEVVNALSPTAIGNGINLLDKVKAVCALASATNPWVIKVDPGVYDLAGATLNVPDHCDIEGSGRNFTVIQSTGSGVGWLVFVNQGVKSEVRDLTIRNHQTGTSVTMFVNASSDLRLSRVNIESMPIGTAITQNVIGLVNTKTASPLIDDLKVTLMGSVMSAVGINADGSPTFRDLTISIAIAEGSTYVGIDLIGGAASFDRATVGIQGGHESTGIRTANSTPVFSDAVVHVDAGPVAGLGYGAFLMDSNVQFKNSSINASGGGDANGIWSDGSSVQIETSQIASDGGFALYNVVGSPIVNVGASRLSSTVGSNGPLHCVRSYDDNFIGLGSGC